MSKGAKVNLQTGDLDNMAALHVAVESHRLEAALKLIELGADVSLKRQDGKSALEMGDPWLEEYRSGRSKLKSAPLAERLLVSESNVEATHETAAPLPAVVSEAPLRKADVVAEQSPVPDNKAAPATSAQCAYRRLDGNKLKPDQLEKELKKGPLVITGLTKNWTLAKEWETKEKLLKTYAVLRLLIFCSQTETSGHESCNGLAVFAGMARCKSRASLCTTAISASEAPTLAGWLSSCTSNSSASQTPP